MGGLASCNTAKKGVGWHCSEERVRKDVRMYRRRDIFSVNLSCRFRGLIEFLGKDGSNFETCKHI